MEIKTIIGYSNLSFLISIKYFLDIERIKNEEIKIKDFINFEKLSTTILSLNIFTVSFSPFKTTIRTVKITKIDNLSLTNDFSCLVYAIPFLEEHQFKIIQIISS